VAERVAGPAVVLFAECAGGGAADQLWGRVGSSGLVRVIEGSKDWPVEHVRRSMKEG
jgi:hypothetical protein